MDQLLQIHTTPIQIDIAVTHAKLNISSKKASFDLTREQNGLTIEHSYPVLHIDSTAARNSMNLKSPLELTRSFAQKGAQAAQDATVRAGQERRAFVATQNKSSEPVCEFAREQIRQSAELIPAAIPAVPSQISWEPQQLKMQYEKDRLAFDWKANHPEFEFTPGSVDFLVKQYPKVDIEYVGKPHYVPPSADPDFKDEAADGTHFQATA